MELINNIKQTIYYQRINQKVLQWLNLAFPKFSKQSQEELLISSINKSLYEWKNAQDQFNHASPGLIDYMVYRLNATERHYIALLSIAKEKGVKAWPDTLTEPIDNPSFEPEYKSSIML